MGQETYFEGTVSLWQWLLLISIGALVVYVAINIFTFLMIVTGSATTAADPFWHAPLYWLFKP